MTLEQLLNEVWKRGNITRDQMLRTVSSTIGNRGTVTPVDRKQDSTGVEAIVSLTYYDFVDIFSGMRGAVDRVLQLSGSKTTHNVDDPYNSKSQQLLTKLIKLSNKNIRQFMPHGWMIGGTMHGVPLIKDLNSNITFNIKRDYAESSPNQTKYYHATLKDRSNSILQQGLKPSRGTRDEYDSYRGRIFLTKSLDHLDFEFLIQLLGGRDMKHRDVDIVVFEVTLPSDYKTYKDPQYGTGGVFGEDLIAPEHLKVIYDGKISGIPWGQP